MRRIVIGLFVAMTLGLIGCGGGGGGDSSSPTPTITDANVTETQTGTTTQKWADNTTTSGPMTLVLSQNSKTVKQ